MRRDLTSSPRIHMWDNASFVPTGKNGILANKGNLAYRLGRVEPKNTAKIAELGINVKRPVVRGR
jgi:hypothetical protein